MTNKEILEMMEKTNPFLIDMYSIEEFSWEYGWIIAKYYPNLLNPEKFNWDKDSSFVVTFCPENIDKDRFDWENQSWAVYEYCPHYLNEEKACVKNINRYDYSTRGKTIKEIKQTALLNRM